MAASVDKSGGRCERCAVLLSESTYSYITSIHTPYYTRNDMDPQCVILARQCVPCGQGKCAATSRTWPDRCDQPRQVGKGACVLCEKSIRTVLYNTCQQHGIELG
jgi:hypothetical protein